LLTKFFSPTTVKT